MNDGWLEQLRNGHNLTHEKVAELAGIERSYYTKIENGTVPSVRVAKRIANVLDFDWTFFFDSVCDELTQTDVTA